MNDVGTIMYSIVELVYYSLIKPSPPVNILFCVRVSGAFTNKIIYKCPYKKC
jgi:hypothetical protein